MDKQRRAPEYPIKKLTVKQKFQTILLEILFLVESYT